MRHIIIAAPLVLGACSGAWPSGSYAPISETEAQSIAPIITTYLASALPRHSEVNFMSARHDPLEPMLNDELQSVGLSRSASGHRVSYVVAPMDNGVLMRVSIDYAQGMSRYFVHNERGELYPEGPAMVAMP